MLLRPLARRGMVPAKARLPCVATPIARPLSLLATHPRFAPAAQSLNVSDNCCGQLAMGTMSTWQLPTRCNGRAERGTSGAFCCMFQSRRPAQLQRRQLSSSAAETVAEGIASGPVVIFSKPSCPFCTQVCRIHPLPYRPRMVGDMAASTAWRTGSLPL